jgi:ATP-dependent Clp protease adaptor protein ClpS
MGDLPNWSKDDHETDEGVLTESKQKVEKPPMFKVLLHNDDYTSQEFVVFVLQSVFHKSFADAFKIMLAVHNSGIGIAGVYTHEVAEAKSNKVVEMAQSEGFPLLCTVEEA